MAIPICKTSIKGFERQNSHAKLNPKHRNETVLYEIINRRFISIWSIGIFRFAAFQEEAKIDGTFPTLHTTEE